MQTVEDWLPMVKERYGDDLGAAKGFQSLVFGVNPEKQGLHIGAAMQMHTQNEARKAGTFWSFLTAAHKLVLLLEVSLVSLTQRS